MTIEKVKRTWFLVDRGELDDFIRALARSKTTHVVDLKEELDPDADDLPGAPFETPPLAADADEARRRVSHLEHVLDLLDAFAPPKRALYENFVSLPDEMTPQEFERHVADVHVDDLYQTAVRLEREHLAAQETAHERRVRIEQLRPWRNAAAPPASLRYCSADLGTVSASALPGLREDARRCDALALEHLGSEGPRALVAAVWLKDGDADAAALLRGRGFSSLGLEPGAGSVAPLVDKLESERRQAEQRAAERAGAIRELAKGRRSVLAALAHWQAEVERRAASGSGLASRRIVVLSGYVRAREMERLQELLAKRFPDVGLVADDPQPDEKVPVSLGGPKLFAPAQFLTAMFGLPGYFEFDPSPFIFFVFLVFFGFCFGDVVYGLMLLGLGAWLARKSGRNSSLVKFFTLLAWCGASAALFGLLTGSWASDLLSPKYLGTGPVASALVRLRQAPALFDLMDRPLIGLGLALAVGILTQFFGIILLMFRESRKGNYVAALCDGGLWLVFLPGLMVLLGSLATDWPAVVRYVALAMVLASGLGLVLTQGRHEESFLAKAVTGVVSLYGILGTYGTTSFLSDTLSYSRLLALGLATVVIGMAFNYIAGLMGRLPWVGVLIFVLAVILGHCFNFLVSILSGFVHSVRLIFVEMFSRFYEGGAPPFAPLGAPRTVRVVDDRAGRR
jgi:V/A-type H+-transporting ATPase subunit I